MTELLRKVRWRNVFMDGSIHIGAIVAIWHFSWSGILVALLLTPVCLIWISLCWHRLLSHASYQTANWLRHAMTIGGCLNLQGGPIEWVGTHRLHHAQPDGEFDPHSPRDGLWWAHFGWVLTPLGVEPSRYARDLQRDPAIRLIDRFFWVPAVILLAALYAAGEWIAGAGLSWLLWGGCVRTVISYHLTWVVNSWTHKWGYRNFDTGDDSRNSKLVAAMTFGEGFHNNHHAQQRSAAHGMFPGEPDVTYLLIRFMARMGLAWNVVEPEITPLDGGAKRSAFAAPGKLEESR